MPILSREALGQWRRRQKVVEAPEFGEGAQLIVAEMSGLDATDYMAELARFNSVPEAERDQRMHIALMAMVAERSVVGEDHAPLFDRGGYLEACAGLGATDMWNLTRRIFEAAMGINGFSDDQASAEGNASFRPNDASRAA